MIKWPSFNISLKSILKNFTLVFEFYLFSTSQFMLNTTITTNKNSDISRDPMDFIMLVIIKYDGINDLGLKFLYKLKNFLYVESQVCWCFDLLIKNSSIFMHRILVSFMGAFHQKGKSGWTFNYNTSLPPTKLIVPTCKMVSQI